MSREAVITLVLALLTGPSLGVLANYLLGRRKAKLEEKQNSGTITTSEAVDLWAESNSLRDAWKDQASTNLARAEKAEEQVRKNNEQLFTVNQKLVELLDEFTKFKHSAHKDSGAMQKKIDELKAIIKRLQDQNKRLLANKKGRQS